ncbi:MAG: hypothetical protein Q9207_007970 [Kuettlingeria erythrocarpa]
MPTPSTPIKSGVHKAACFALYRALLRQSQQVLAPEPAKLFRKSTKDAFHAGSKTRRQREITAALYAGYNALSDLALNPLAISKQLLELPKSQGIGRQLRSRGNNTARVENSTPGKSRTGITGRDLARRWPYPDARPVLKGLPPPPPSKPRQVPTLINANHIPFLRIKKPQSPFISYIIRKKNDEREKRIDRIQALENQLAIAEEEDQWDQVLWQHRQIPAGGNEVRWTSAIQDALTKVKRVHHVNAVKRMCVAERMLNILQEQKRLAEQERLDRRDRRHQAYKARRSQRQTLDDVAPSE